jgi:phosphinothricin acetyltransferase
MSGELVVRASVDADAPDIAAIYADHVRHGLASFEEVPPDAAELARRRRAVLAEGLPYLVAARAGRIVGYAYAAPYRARAAYRYSVEDSVYVATDCGRQGIGRALLAPLIVAATAAGKRQMIAVIGDSANHASIGLHAALGFRHAGTLTAVGFKLGRWVDSVLMQRPLGPGDGALPD